MRARQSNRRKHLSQTMKWVEKAEAKQRACLSMFTAKVEEELGADMLQSVDWDPSAQFLLADAEALEYQLVEKYPERKQKIRSAIARGLKAARDKQKQFLVTAKKMLRISRCEQLSRVAFSYRATQGRFRVVHKTSRHALHGVRVQTGRREYRTPQRTTAAARSPDSGGDSDSGPSGDPAGPKRLFVTIPFCTQNNSFSSPWRYSSRLMALASEGRRAA